MAGISITFFYFAFFCSSGNYTIQSTPIGMMVYNIVYFCSPLYFFSIHITPSKNVSARWK